SAADDYARLQKWHFSEPIPLPAGGVTIARDTATWTLRSGTIRLMQPASGGAVTGAVFEGEGRFTMTIPDRFELLQLRRFANKAELQSIDEPITQLVIRTSDATILDVLPRPPANAAYGAHSLATKRHEQWLVKRFDDVDAHIVAALLNPGAVKTTIDANTDGFDWLTWDYDSAAEEEISLVRYHPVMPESWVSLDRPEDRRADGRPGERPSELVALEHIDVKADLTKTGRIGPVGRNHQNTIDGKYVVEATFSALADEVSALRLNLWTSAREVKAFGEDGAPLTLFRDHIGKRSGMLDNKLHDDDLTVVLPAPLRRGERRRIRFEYEVETANYAPGSLWYPTPPDGIDRRHTARLELTVRRKNEVRAMGKLESRTDGEKTETSVWVVERPAKMVTFSTATRFDEVTVKPGSRVPVITFGPDYQFNNRERMESVGDDVANSLAWLSELLQDELAGERMYVTSIASRHGQAFDGFLHLGEFTFGAERGGASELFRAHEVAHAWWGHKVGFKSYRDQWLSEAFAEYSAMLFVRETLKSGEKYFDEILLSYGGIVKGNLAGGFSRFNRPWLIERNVSERRRIGPIGHGVRAVTGEIPTAYLIQTYFRGPLVVHMLRMLLAYETGSEDAFRAVLRDLVREYGSRSASTGDLARIVARHAPKLDWTAFFDSWIRRAEIPSYVWSYDVAAAEGGYALTVKLRRRDAGEGFTAFVPLRVQLEDGTASTLLLVNDRDEQTATYRFPSRPAAVTFAPDHSLLANARRSTGLESASGTGCAWRCPEPFN
ncbi:MAG TPA: M1 family aminopeptidase, partial [Thermoanaerobaculia bacterium]|nr:M1 family aminopeptidase [Thermoanaerobaculia bacterium]